MMLQITGLPTECRRPKTTISNKTKTPRIMQPDCKFNRTSRLQQFNLFVHCLTAMLFISLNLRTLKMPHILGRPC
jgi:hypothetical protein